VIVILSSLADDRIGNHSVPDRSRFQGNHFDDAIVRMISKDKLLGSQTRAMNRDFLGSAINECERGCPNVTGLITLGPRMMDAPPE
jgi:hypothetical protein